MRVLMACDPGGDGYSGAIAALCDLLRESGIAVEAGIDRFWLRDRSYDIVHLHWPEALFRWRCPDWPALRILLTDVLPSWRRDTKVVITRHNSAPHSAHESPLWQVLYERIYDHVDGVVHLGEYGIREFMSEGRRTGWIDTIIPHHMYRSYGNPVDKSYARRTLRIPSCSKVVLVFGTMRCRRERMLVQDAFLKVNSRSKLLLAPNFGAPVRPSRRKPLEWLLWEAQNRSAIWPRRMQLGRHVVPDDSVRLYFGAADVVLVPRLDTLNSGLVPLAFQFGKVTVGPDIGNIGPVLKAAGNPVFDPDSPASVADALLQGLEMSESDLGVRNARFAAEHWSSERIAMMHQRFYEKTCQHGSVTPRRA